LSKPLGEGKLPIKKRLSHRKARLSQPQKRVVELVAKGLKNREIAVQLGIGSHVVRNYLSAIYAKIGVSNRVELALWYQSTGCLSSPVAANIYVSSFQSIVSQ
jgi:DNA-binding CsgD family transcriptional regulator